MARLIAILLALLPAVVTALEVDDLRIGYSPWGGREFDAAGQVVVVTPTGYSLNSQEEVSTDVDRHRRASLAYHRSVGPLQAGFGAPLWGVELAQDTVSENQGTISYNGRSQLLDVIVGWAWKVRPDWHVEQGLIAGAGHAH